MAIKGAIIDMDGTLLDSMHLWVGVGGRYVRKLGYEPTPEQEKAMNGLMIEPMADYVKDNFPVGGTQEIHVRGLNSVVEPGYMSEVVPKPTVPETLEKMKALGIRMVVATATDRALTEAALERTGLAPYFEHIFCAPDKHQSKYQPEIFREAVYFLGLPDNEIYVFEDTLSSIRGAKAAGLKVIALRDKWSEKKRDTIKAEADIYVEKMADIDFPAL